MKYIFWFNQVGKKDLAQVGGKGANLGELIKAKIPVPDGFIVSAAAYFDFLKKEKIDQKIKDSLEGLDPEDTKALNRTSSKIKKAISEGKIPREIEKEIIEAYKKIGREEFVAVRSSATAEDLPGASFAGQQATFLNVLGVEEIVKRVQDCWASLFESRAIYYRIQQGFDHLKVGIAVPVQKMIQSEKSGVMFTINPVNNDKSRIMIEAGYGLGEAVVSGAITPDQYLVDKQTLEIVSREINKQTWQIKKENGENKHLKIEEDLQTKQKLSDEEIIELAKLGIKIEDYYKFPQDTEWGIEQGKIYLLQSRPVTTMGEKSKVEDKKIEKREERKLLLKGIGASLGRAFGPVKIIFKPQEIDKVKEGEVLVTEMTTPDFVPAMKRAAAIVTDTGGRTCHAAIVSRELGIPCVVGTGKATSVLKNGQVITVEGITGEVLEGRLEEATQPIQIASQIRIPSQMVAPITGTKILVNLAEPELAEEISKMPVDGIGLLRAEFMIAAFGEHPKKAIKENREEDFIDQLTQGIRRFVQSFNPRPVIYRATDFKTNEYQGLKGGEKFEKEEANPMIGYRGAFRYLKDKDVFDLEIRAIKKVREEFGFKNLWLMIPFVRTINEFSEIREILEERGLKQSNDFKLLIMIEVPSTVFLIEEFCRLGIDGVSIGSNDLTQLILGIDRDNSILQEEFDERNEAVLKAIRQIIRACKKYGVSSSICGQAPSVYPDFTEFLVREGITSISVNPDMILETRKLVSSCERKLIIEKLRKL